MADGYDSNDEDAPLADDTMFMYQYKNEQIMAKYRLHDKVLHFEKNESNKLQNKYFVTLGFDKRMEDGEVKEKALMLKIWDIKKLESYIEYSYTVPTGGEMFPTFIQSKMSPICYRIKINKKDYVEDANLDEGEGIRFAVSKDLAYCTLITQDK